MIGSKIANKIRKDSPQKLVHKRKKIIEIPKNVYNFRENINIMIIHHLRVISQFNNGISKSNKLVRQYAKSIIKFKTKNGIRINDERCRTYNINNPIKSKNTVLKSSLCTYSDVNILLKGTISVKNTGAANFNINNGNIKLILKEPVLHSLTA